MADPLTFGDMAVLMTAWRRPHYLEDVLGSWIRAAGSGELAEFRVAIDPSDRLEQTVQTVQRLTGAWPPAVMQVNPARRGVSCNPADSAAELLEDHPALRFLVFAEEDIIVADDVLCYLAWAASTFEQDPRVLLVCAHPGREGADPSAARLKQQFNPWIWGTWPDRWRSVIEPTWDRNYSTGDAECPQSGFDWNLDKRIIPRGNYLACFPELSRSQNIGQWEGVHASPADFPGTVLSSFREHYEPGGYRIVTD